MTRSATRALLDGIDVATLVGLRDRALLGVLVYSFARASAAVSLRVADYYTQGPRSFFRLHEKGGRYNASSPPTTQRKPTSTPTSPPPASAKTAADPCSAAASPGGAMHCRTG